MNSKLTVNQIVVFLGPSLKLETAQCILPNAVFLPPVKCGDIIRILQFQPKIIAIIDGYFDQTPAVWHKEIILALEKGVIVFGSSSMGALRAAELVEYGMIGVGEIYNLYLHGTINDDDEVAILHTPAPDFISLTDAMVNIRATLMRAKSEKIICETTALALCKIAKNKYYHQRVLNELPFLAQAYFINETEKSRFCHWLRPEKYVDLKKQDAELLLRRVNTLNDRSRFAGPTKITANKTTYLRALQRDALYSIYNEENTTTTSCEKYQNKMGYSETATKMLEFLARLLSAADAIATKKITNPLSDEIDDIDILSKLYLPSSYADNEYDSDFLHEFCFRIKRYQKIINDEKNNVCDSRAFICSSIISIMQINGHYPIFKAKDCLIENYQQEEPTHYAITHVTALFYWVINSYIQQLTQRVSTSTIKQYTELFRRQRNLLCADSMKAWLNANNLTITGFEHLMVNMAQITTFAIDGNLFAISLPEINVEVNWFLEAVCLTNNFSIFK